MTTQFSINEHVYNFKIQPIAYKKAFTQLFQNISYFELLVNQFR
jgi:hypothetical protein